MKNKKLIILMSIILVISILTITMVGCKDSFSLSKIDKESNVGKSFSSDVKQLSAIAGWELEQGNSRFLSMNKYDETGLVSKMLYSLESDKALLTITADIDAFAFDYSVTGVVIVKNSLTKHTDVYDANGIVFSADTTDYSISYDSENYTIYFSNGKTVIVNQEDFSVKVVDTTIVEESPSREKLGEFFIENDSSMTFKVYDENGKYLRSVSFAECMTSTNNILSASANNEGVVLLQFLKALPSSATEYDYIYEGVKYNLVSVAKSLKTGKSVDLKLDDGVVYAIYPDENYNYITGTKYKLTQAGEMVALESGFFDDDFKCLFNVLSYGLSGTITTDSLPTTLGNGDLMISCKGEFVIVIDSEGNVKGSYLTENLTPVGYTVDGLPLYQLAGTNQLYDVYGKPLFTLPETASLVTVSSPSDYIYYRDSVTETDSEGLEVTTNYYYAMNIKTSEVKTLGKTSDIDFSHSDLCYVVRTTDESGKVTASAYSVIDGKAIYTDIDISSVSVTSQMLYGSEYPVILFCMEDAEGNMSYVKYSFTYANA